MQSLYPIIHLLSLCLRYQEPTECTQRIQYCLTALYPLLRSIQLQKGLALLLYQHQPSHLIHYTCPLHVQNTLQTTHYLHPMPIHCHLFTRLYLTPLVLPYLLQYLCISYALRITHKHQHAQLALKPRILVL